MLVKRIKIQILLRLSRRIVTFLVLLLNKNLFKMVMKAISFTTTVTQKKYMLVLVFQMAYQQGPLKKALFLKRFVIFRHCQNRICMMQKQSLIHI